MHDDPQVEIEGEVAGEDAHQVGVTAREDDLAEADAEAGAQCGQLRQVAVGAQSEGGAIEEREAFDDGTDRGRLAIEADQVVLAERSDLIRRPAPVQIVAMRVQAKGDGRQPAGDQRLLGGGTMRTAMSASWRSRSCSAFDSASSRISPG